MSKKTIYILSFILIAFFAVTAFAQNSGFDTKNLDGTVSPAKDFYQFAEGKWAKNNPIPDEYSYWGAFSILYEENNKVLKKIVIEAAKDKNAQKGSALQKIGDFYATGMDSARIERDGYKPIVPDLKKIDALTSTKDLIKLIAEHHFTGTNTLFSFSVDVDSKKSSLMAPYLSQGRLGLPDVSYYTNDDTRSKEIREKYIQYVANMFKLIDIDETTAAQNAQTIMDIETKLAKASNTRLENRDAEKTYNKMTIDNLKNIASGFNWDLYLENLGVGNLNLIIVSQPRFFSEMSKMIDNIPLDDWKVFLKWKIIRDAAGALSSPFVNERFEFNGKYLNGTKVNQPRWKRIIGSMNGFMGELIGQLYVKEAFPPEAKERALKIVNSIIVSMGESIKGLEWMSDATKKEALYKLSKFGVKIGYPDKWKDYSGLEIARDSYYKNLERASKWGVKEELSKIGKPVDVTEWGMSPQTVNAYNSSERNEIVFPAGILQPPFFDPKADDAINYGAMGAVIGHEITHGFDDQGRKYNAEGNIKDWWTKEDGEKFDERAQKLVNQYNNMVVIDTFKVNGALTLGENIADIGGLTISFNAFKNTEQFKKNEKIDGFTPAQRFFLGWAQVWASYTRPEALRMQVKTDVHSPSVQRVNGPMQNLPEFFKAYDVKPGDPMRNPDDKIVKIW